MTVLLLKVFFAMGARSFVHLLCFVFVFFFGFLRYDLTGE